jgi:hypothetical protein
MVFAWMHLIRFEQNPIDARHLGEVRIPGLEKRDNKLIDDRMPRGMMDPRGSEERIRRDFLKLSGCAPSSYRADPAGRHAV